MPSSQTVEKEARLYASNVGGITETEVTFSRGITILTGRNATNRTSLLQAIMAVMGSTDVTLKGDADEGSVELEFDGRLCSRRLVRQNGDVVFDGDPYLDDPLLADLFAFLLESNGARRAVARTDDLRGLIMQPVDTDEIESEIRRLEAEKNDIDDQLAELTDRENRLPALKERCTELESEITRKEAELAAAEEDIAALDATVEKTKAEEAELESKLGDLRDVRSTLEEVRFDIRSERNSLDALSDRKAELESESEGVGDVSDVDPQRVESELDRLRSEIQRLSSLVTELNTVIQFNEKLLDGSSDAVAEALFEEGGETGVATDQLVDDDDTVCWTCGSEVEMGRIGGTVERLRGVRESHRRERNRLRERVETLETEMRAYEQARDQRQRIEDGLSQVEAEIVDREDQLEDLQARREELESAVEELEAEVTGLEDEGNSDVLELHRRANGIEFELGQLHSDLERVEAEIADVNANLESREEISSRRDEIREEGASLRTRIEDIEAEAVEQFNHHMETVLDLLNYENIERVWIERTEERVREGNRMVTKGRFDIHVVRSTQSGAVYEDTIDHLSESEREVTGLVFALAGYLVHEVYEVLPFVLLDSLEALDANRIAAVIEYFGDYTDFLIAALLPEDAAALDDSHARISES